MKNRVGKRGEDVDAEDNGRSGGCIRQKYMVYMCEILKEYCFKKSKM